MKMVSINTGWIIQRLIITDDEKALTAYASLKSAMETYERYGNDKLKAVTITDESGESTFKLDNLVSVAIEDLSENSDEVFIQCGQRNKRLKDKLEIAAPGVVLRAHDQTGEQSTVVD